MAQVPQISGVTATETRSQLIAIATQPVFDRAMTRLAPSDRDMFVGATAVGWLPIPVVEGAVSAVAREANMRWEDLLAESTRRTQERLLTTVHRLFMRLTTDEWLISRTPAIYAKTYDTGALSSTFPAKHQAIVALTGWPEISDMQMLGLGVGIETTLRIAGRAEAKTVAHRNREGVAFHCSWKK